MYGIRAGLFFKKDALHILGYYTTLWQKGKIGGLKICEVFEQNLIFNQNKKKTFFKSKSNLSRFLQLLISPSLRLYFLVIHVSLPTFSSDAFGVKTGPKNLCRLMFLFFFKKKHVFLQGTINMS